jgi:hypothetical protein
MDSEGSQCPVFIIRCRCCSSLFLLQATNEPSAGVAATIKKTDRTYHMLTLESISKYTNPRVYHPCQITEVDEFDVEGKASVMIDQKSLGASDVMITTALAGAEYVFSRYIPNLNTTLRLDMYLEDVNGSRR